MSRPSPSASSKRSRGFEETHVSTSSLRPDQKSDLFNTFGPGSSHLDNAASSAGSLQSAGAAVMRSASGSVNRPEQIKEEPIRVSQQQSLRYTASQMPAMRQPPSAEDAKPAKEPRRPTTKSYRETRDRLGGELGFHFDPRAFGGVEGDASGYFDYDEDDSPGPSNGGSSSKPQVSGDGKGNDASNYPENDDYWTDKLVSPSL
jgi:hypothetical protein